VTYFSGKDWWDTRFKVRRSISITPFSFLAGSESHCAVKLKKTDINGKIKPDYSDLNLIFQPDDGLPYLIPYYVLDEGTEISIVFQPVNSIVYTDLAEAYPGYEDSYDVITGDIYTPILVGEGASPSQEHFISLNPQPAVPASVNEYFLYYTGKADTKLDNRTDNLDPDDLYLQDYGQEDENTRWTFQKPTINWTGNSSDTSNSTALFKFIGHKVDLYFETGPTYGKFKYSINDSDYTEVDCYSGTSMTSKVASIDTGVIGTNRLRIESLGTKSPASSSDKITLNRVNYHQILVGEPESEEFYSLIGKAVSTGA